MVSFDLSPEQTAIQSHVRAFANTHLSKARSLYETSLPHQEWSSRFRSTQPSYAEAVKSGLIAAQVYKALKGGGGPLIDAAIVVEELYAVETSASLTILAAGLVLTPLIMAGSPEQHSTSLKPFVSGEGTPLASLVFSEPGGGANYAEKGAPRLSTIAFEDGDELVITNCSGWDDRGAELQCVVCRVPKEAVDVRDQVAIVIVTREDIARNEPGAFEVLEHPETLGHTAATSLFLEATRSKG